MLATGGPGGADRTLLAARTLSLAEAGDAALDGMIVVATRTSEQFPTVYDDVWAISWDGARRHLTNGAFPGISAFAWAPGAVLDMASLPR